MDLHSSNDKPAGATGSALPPIADCGASSDVAPVTLPADSTPDHGRSVQSHRSGGGVNVNRSRRITSTMVHIAALAMLGAVSGEARNINTGREVSRWNSERVEEDRKRAAQLRSEQPIDRPAPYGKVQPAHKSQQDLDRLAAAQAKRDRRHAKRVGAQS